MTKSREKFHAAFKAKIALEGFVRATAGRLRWAQQAQTQAESKSPPAKPGALGFEPLKAAWGRLRGPVPHSEVPLRKNIGMPLPW